MHDPRQVLCETLHPQAMQIDPYDARVERAAPDDSELALRRAHRCCVLVRVGKGSDAAAQHNRLFWCVLFYCHRDLLTPGLIDIKKVPLKFLRCGRPLSAWSDTHEPVAPRVPV